MKHFLPIALLIPTAAMAHPGHHDGLTLTDALTHLASHTDHAALILVALGAALFLLHKVRI